MEKLCLAIGVSWLIVYLAATAIYLCNLPRGWNFAFAGVCLVLLFASLGEGRRIFAHRQVRRAVSAFGALWLWIMLLCCIIRHYSGGDWFGDWFEHYQRSLFFLHLDPLDTRFINVYLLPARPPMFNLIGAYLLAMTGESFACFQVACVFLNLLVFFPCVLIAPVLSGSKRRIATILIFLAASPVLVENATFTWTKLFAAFYVILGTWLYWRGWTKQDPKRTIAAFIALATGVIVHYSAGIFLLFFAIHFAITLMRRRNRLSEAAGSAAGMAIVLLSWFGWSVAKFGWNQTLSSNSVVIDSRKLSFWGNLAKIGSNLLATLLPHPLHVSRARFMLNFAQPNGLGFVRDYWHQIYQTTLIAGMGSVGGIVVIGLIWKTLRSVKTNASQGLFWGSFVAFCAIAGIAVHGAAMPWGVAHVCLQPLILLGITLLAGRFAGLPVWVRRWVLFGLTFDFCLGIFLQVHIERLLIAPQPMDSLQLLPMTDQLLNINADSNLRIRAGAGLDFLGDHFITISVLMQVAAVLFFAAMLFALARRDSWKIRIALLALLGGGILFCITETATPQTPADNLRTAGEWAYANGRMLSAMDVFAEAYIVDPMDWRARFDLNLAYSQSPHAPPDMQQRVEAADEVFEHPDSTEARARLAAILAKRGRATR